MWNLIAEDILESFKYLKLSIVIASFLVVLYIMFNKFIKNKSIGIKTIVPMFILVVYLVSLLQIVFFSREPGSRDGIDLHLFGTITGDARGNSYVIENIFLFIPLGFLVPLVFNKVRTFWRCIPIGFLLSICIEVTQLLTKRGFCQLDDVIMNTLGCMIGFLIWRLMEYNYKRFPLLERD